MSQDEAIAPARARSLALPTIFTLVGLIVLCGLGFWQLERKAWKEGLIAAIDERSHQEPVAFPPPSVWADLSPERDEYRRVRLEGHFLNDKEAHLQANLVSRGPDDGALGYDILTPFALADGSLVIVNRGFVPLAAKEASSRAQGQVEGDTSLTGLIRFPQSAPWFAPADDPKRNVWFSRNPAAIAKADGLERIAPVMVDADAGPAGVTRPDAAPRAGQTRITLRNEHLQYALTWFGLAIVLAAVFGAYAWGGAKPPH